VPDGFESSIVPDAVACVLAGTSAMRPAMTAAATHIGLLDSEDFRELAGRNLVTLLTMLLKTVIVPTTPRSGKAYAAMT
jgi:hypothetical protein